jgi:hypothetical protein
VRGSVEKVEAKRTLAAKSRALLFAPSLSPRSLQLWWERSHLFTSIDRKRQERIRKLKSYMHKRKKPLTVKALESESTGCSRRAERYGRGLQMNHMVEPIAGAPFRARSSWFWM